MIRGATDDKQVFVLRNIGVWQLANKNVVLLTGYLDPVDDLFAINLGFVYVDEPEIIDVTL